jgi:hypothetical protein
MSQSESVVRVSPANRDTQPEEEDGILREALASLPCFGHRRCCSEMRESVLLIVYFTPLTTQTKFIDHFNEQNKTIQHFHTTSTSAKRGRHNMDDTDTKSDDDDPEAVVGPACVLGPKSFNLILFTSPRCPIIFSFLI